jgi:uncharacterized BrkB/YihY/UPF0761 family membrane protein
VGLAWAAVLCFLQIAQDIHLVAGDVAQALEWQGLYMGILVAAVYKFCKKITRADEKRCHYFTSLTNIFWSIGGIFPIASAVAACVVSGHAIFTHIHKIPRFDESITRWFRATVEFAMLKQNLPPVAWAYFCATLHANGIN